jgi:hypothetical protein
MWFESCGSSADGGTPPLRERILIQSKFESLIAPAICNERASAKPAGDKQAKACLDYSAPSSQLFTRK